MGEPTPFDDIESEDFETPFAALIAILSDIRTDIRRGNAQAAGAVSSVKITLQRGTIDVGIHAYVGSPVEHAELAAIQSYRRVLQELNQDGVEAFRKTLEVLRDKHP